MLVLTRKKNQQIKIGDNITIVISEIRGDKVRIAIEAPKNIPVHRQEVYEAIQRQLAQEASQRVEPVDLPAPAPRKMSAADILAAARGTPSPSASKLSAADILAAARGPAVVAST